MTPYFAFAMIILFSLCAVLGGLSAALLLADKPHPAPLFESAITATTTDTSPSRLQTTQFVNMDVVQLQGIFTALLQDAQSTDDNPYPIDSQAHAVWVGGYAMAAAQVQKRAAASRPTGAGA